MTTVAPAIPVSPDRVIAITGATGLLGSALCEHFARAGWAVRALSRRPLQLPPTVAAGVRARVSHYHLDLPEHIPASAFDGCDAVVHAAYSMRSVDRAADARVNLDGTRRLLRGIRAAGVPRYVFVSSVSAHEQAQGFYGQSKLTLELELDPATDLIVRPGLILARHAGLFVRMLRVVRSSGIAPLFGGGRQIIQTVHIADLCDAFRAALDRDIRGSVTVCEPGGLPMRDLFLLMASMLKRRLFILPLPFGPAIFALRAAEALGLRLPVSSDNLLGLRSMKHFDSRPDLARLGVTLRDAPDSLAHLLEQEDDT